MGTSQLLMAELAFELPEGLPCRLVAQVPGHTLALTDSGCHVLLLELGTPT